MDAKKTKKNNNINNNGDNGNTGNNKKYKKYSKEHFAKRIWYEVYKMYYQGGDDAYWALHPELRNRYF